MKPILILLTMNELEGCKVDLPRLPKKCFEKIIAVDGNSTDGTVEYLLSQGVEVIKQNQPTYNGALSTMLSVQPGFPLVIFHPKGAINPSILIEICKLLLDGNDLVIASRMLKSAQNEEDLKILRFRKWFGTIVGYFMFLRYGEKGLTRVTDPLHGLRGLSGSYRNTLSFRPGDITGDLEMVVSAYLRKAKIVETPVIENSRISGTTHFPAIKSGVRILKYLILMNSSKTMQKQIVR